AQGRRGFSNENGFLMVTGKIQHRLCLRPTRKVRVATPTLGSPTVKEDGQTIPLDLNDPEQAQQAWDEWFVPFFETIHQNEDVIKAISYINCYWKSHPMWENNPTFQYVDARLQQNEMISEKWKAEMASGRYLHSSAGLFDQLWGDKK
ncbi:MAG: hypothetical protein AAFP92_22605, partial [Bacteroidota bacterium]